VAEVDGQPWAALSLAGGELLTDPFRPTAELAPLLSLRAAQIHASNAAQGRAQRAPVLPMPRTRRAAPAKGAVQRLRPPPARAG
jgi:hypothetical protein